MLFFCQNASKKRIKFQTFSQAWGKPQKNLLEKTLKQEPKQEVKKLEPVQEPVLQPRHVPPAVQEQTTKEVLPIKRPEIQSKSVEPEQQTISLDLHYTMIKWLSLLFISNLVLLCLVFIILWINR
jgi:hypothetical protein